MLDVREINEVRKIEINTAVSLVTEPSAFEFEFAIEMLERHKSPDDVQIPAELFKQEVEKFALRSINLLILFRIRSNCLRSGRSRSLYLSTRIRRAIKNL